MRIAADPLLPPFICSNVRLFRAGALLTDTPASTPASVPQNPGAPERYVSMLELCIGFLLVGLLGFGGLSASGYYVIVERNQWLDRKDYVEFFGICSVLPGGNVLNASVMLGDRYQGPLGSIMALSSLMLAPLAILMAIAVLYDHFSYLPDVKAAAAGAASAVAGMTMGAAAKMAHGLRRSWASPVFALATFAAIAVLRIPLAAVVLVVAPIAVLTAILEVRMERRRAANSGNGALGDG